MRIKLCCSLRLNLDIKTFSVFLSCFKNMSGTLGERKMLCVSAPKLSRVFLQFGRNTEKIISIPLRKHGEKNKGNPVVYFDYQNANL